MKNLTNHGGIFSVRRQIWHTTAGPQSPIAAVIGSFTNPVINLISDCRQFKKDWSGPPAQNTAKSLGEANGELAKNSEVKIIQTHNSKRRRTAVANFATSVLGHSLKAPVAFFYNLANGFHNCPAVLYSDHTVRSYPPITGLSSGLVRSGKEFGFGLYDAVTGLVTQPYLGYKEASNKNESRGVGILKGVGKGFGGLLLKPGAAVTGIPGYGFKGVERRIERWLKGSDVFLHGETGILQAAKDQVKNEIQMARGERSRVQMMWDDSKGSGMGKRILERRVWQGYREIMEMRAKEDWSIFEQDILDRWDKLTASHGHIW
jgi:hypothetical protein